MKVQWRGMKTGKGIGLLLICGMLLAGCGQGNTEPDTPSISNTPNTDTQADNSTDENEGADTVETEDTNQGQADSRLRYTYETSVPHFTINVEPEYMGYGTYSSYDNIFRVDEDGSSFIVSPYYDRMGYEDDTDLSAIQTPADVINGMFDTGVLRAVSINYDISSFTVDYSEDVEINGISTTKNKGTVSVCYYSGTPYKDCSYVSYGLIAETGRPYFFVAIDFSDDQHYIDEFEEMLDLMMPTFQEGGDTNNLFPEE